MGSVNDGSCPDFIPKVIEFPGGVSYELTQPLTNFKSCHDGTPAESRIVFICRQINQGTSKDDGREFVVKIKVQISHNYLNTPQEPQEEPSTTTTAEINALQIFTQAKNPHVPHLVALKQEAQSPDGLLPGGYITYTVMTKLPGQNLLDLQYWSITSKERDLIMDKFWRVLQSIYDLGIEPIDRALRNVLWEQETQTCTIVDFELWHEAKKEKAPDRTYELQRWGLARRPAPQSWWGEWNAHMR
jgi:hypothetical protein